MRRSRMETVGNPLRAPECACGSNARDGETCPKCGKLVTNRARATVIIDADAAQLARDLETATAVLTKIADSPASQREDRSMCRQALQRIRRAG
jgi:RNA polymerase subunit RPABC4/transcription elongation factor Spt4